MIVRFDELGPVSKNMSVYYNGFKVAKIVKIDPDKDFKHTLVRVNFLTGSLKLPRNTTVQLKSFPNGELYLDNELTTLDIFNEITHLNTSISYLQYLNLYHHQQNRELYQNYLYGKLLH